MPTCLPTVSVDPCEIHSPAEISSPSGTITVSASGDDNQTFALDVAVVPLTDLLTNSSSAMTILANALMSNPTFRSQLEDFIESLP